MNISNRYIRQTLLDEIGEVGQQKLSESSVLVIGAGGLGSPVSMYLASAGIGHLGIADDDRVSLSNLQRQILYTEEMSGLPKALVAAERLSAMNSCIEVFPVKCRITEENISDILENYTVVVDCCDNYMTRKLVNDVCISLDKVYIYGAIQGFEGQVSVFDRKTIKYTDLFPYPPENPSKAVMGMTAGIVGSVQAHEVVKIICGYGIPLRNKLWTIDLRTMESNIIELWNNQ